MRILKYAANKRTASVDVQITIAGDHRVAVYAVSSAVVILET